MPGEVAAYGCEVGGVEEQSMCDPTPLFSWGAYWHAWTPGGPIFHFSSFLLEARAGFAFVSAAMIYSFSLHSVGLLVGLLLIALHVVALLHPGTVQQALRRFPRSKEAGWVLFTVDAVWAFALVTTIDLGEFTAYRNIFLAIIGAGYFLTLFFVEEFLASRALGMFCLLAAEPLLEAAFLRPETSRLLLTVLAYAWATAGLFWVGKPYLLRDQIEWVSKTSLRWRLAALGGAAYGAVILLVALTQYGA